MGQHFGGLVRDNSALTQNGITTPVGQEQALEIANKGLPAVAAQSANPMATLDGGKLSFATTTNNAPLITTPKFRDVASERGGESQNPLSPSLTTKGKLLSSLLLAARGAADAVEGGALNVRPGQSSFGTGFASAADAPRRRLLEQNQLSQQAAQLQTQQQEAALRQNEIANAPLLFKQKYDLTNSEIDKNKKLGNYYDAGTDKRSQNPTKYIPGKGLVDTVTGKVITAVDPKQITPNSESALRYAAAQGDEDALAAVKALDDSRKTLKATPSGGTSNSGLASQAASTAANFLNAHGGDANAALSDFNNQIAGKSVDHADLVIAAIKKGGGSGAKKSVLTFNNQPQAAH